MIKTIALISPLDGFDNYGLRSISSYLKSRGINTRMIFLPTYTQIWQIVSHQKKPEIYSLKILKQISNLVKDCDAVGFTMLSSDRERVKAIADHLRPLGKKMVSGGIHPSSFPEDALKITEHVIVGEGYEPLYEWCMAPERTDIGNLWVKTPSGIIANKIRPAMKNIDDLPFPDYGPEGHYICENETIKPITYKTLKKYMGKYYSVFTSHGCPFECSFCINSTYKKLGQGYDCFRHHSVDYVIAQIKYCLSLSSNLEFISIPDDGFIFHSESYIEEFCIKYKQEINLPFAVMGIIPSYLTKKKLRFLVDAGLKRTRVGLQSGNKSVLKSYRRPGLLSKFEDCHNMLKQYPHLVFPYYDFIIDNPIVDTERDMLDSITFLMRLKGRFTLILYSMRMYYGTEIYEKARHLKIKPHYFDSHYGNYSNCILTFTLMVIQSTNSRLLTGLLLKVYKKYGNIKLPACLFSAGIGIWMVRQAIEHLRKGDVSTLPNLVSTILIKSKRKAYPGWKLRHKDLPNYFKRDNVEF